MGERPHQSSPEEGGREPTLARVDAFSDAVFAFAITLLALGLVIPRIHDDGNGAWRIAALADGWPIFLSVLSFILIGLIWVNHPPHVQLLPPV